MQEYCPLVTRYSPDQNWIRYVIEQDRCYDQETTSPYNYVCAFFFFEVTTNHYLYIVTLFTNIVFLLRFRLSRTNVKI